MISRWPQALAILLASAIAIGFYICYVGTAQFSDEGSVCTIGQALLDGKLPYRDYFNEKPPLQYVWTAAVMAVGGVGIQGARLASTITLLLTLAICLTQAARQRRPLLVLMAAMTVLIATGSLMSVFNNTAESSLALFFAAAIAVLFDSHLAARPVLRAGLAGALVGIACGFRVTSVLFGLVLIASPWLAGSRRAFTFGFVAGLSLWVGWLAAAGIIDDAISAMLLFHVNNPLSSSYFRGLGSADRVAVLAWLCTMIASCMVARARSDSFWVLLCALAAAVPFFGRMDPFRLWPSTATLLLLLLRDRSTRTLVGSWALAVPVLLLGCLGFHQADNFKSVQRVVDAIERHSAPTDRIWVAPFSPSVYCLSARPSASRYYFILPWTATPSVQSALMRDLQGKRPRLVVELLGSGFVLSELLPAVTPWLRREYVVVESNEQARYWRLKPGATEASK